MKSGSGLLKVWMAVALMMSSFFGFSNPDSSRLRISLLTCSAGSELYSVFGHNALRIVDSAAGTDVVYNYGTFDFDDPDFYTKFVRGKLMYFLSQVSYPDFLYEYAYFGRGVKEQVLNITEEEKKSIQQFLFNNVRAENRYYKYDFLYDNCTTRLRDIIFHTGKDDAFEPPNFLKQPTTFREHLHSYLNRAEMPWTKLGIDMLLGVGADKAMSVNEAMFLPDYLHQGLSVTIPANGPLVLENVELLPDAQPKPVPAPFYLTPIFLMSLISIVCVMPFFMKGTRAESFQFWMDRFLFLSTGILGCLLLFMWLGTDHESFANNLNLLWALPLNVLVPFARFSRSGYFIRWLKGYSVLLLLLFVPILLQPTVINMALYPIIIALSFRAMMLHRKLADHHLTTTTK